MHKISWMPNNYRHHESKNEEKMQLIISMRY